MITQQLLNKAISLGCNVYQNYLGKWVIKGFVDKKLWILQEEKNNSWLITYDEMTQMPIKTEQTIAALELLARQC